MVKGNSLAAVDIGPLARRLPVSMRGVFDASQFINMWILNSVLY